MIEDLADLKPLQTATATAAESKKKYFLRDTPGKKVFVLPFLFMLALSALCFFAKNPDFEHTKRYLFYFPARTKAGEAVFTETRYLKNEWGRNVDSFENAQLNAEITLFLEDLVLGPVNVRFTGLFPADTKLTSSFVQNGILYVSLSGNGFFSGDSAFAGSKNFTNTANLLKKNVLSNFSGINSIKIFINNQKISDV
ncbi:MAG: hypothetical protein Ta2A_15890 [Treponemataceae bacterium]|nr:MAG: hypothetical protein Ta2A_15890 [Treponemataceae bacterium]